MSNLLATDAKALSDAAVINATSVATQAFIAGLDTAIQTAANTGAYRVTVAVPGGLNLDTITAAFQAAGYTIQYLANNTSLTLDWQNPNNQNTIPSTANANTIFNPAP
jgi:hypothetical protein